MIQKEKMRNEQETISIEEYLNRRRKLREKERRNRKEQTYEKESSPWMLAELSGFVFIVRIIRIIFAKQPVEQCIGIEKNRNEDRTGNGSFKEPMCL